MILWRIESRNHNDCDRFKRRIADEAYVRNTVVNDRELLGMYNLKRFGQAPLVVRNGDYSGAKSSGEALQREKQMTAFSGPAIEVRPAVGCED